MGNSARLTLADYHATRDPKAARAIAQSIARAARLAHSAYQADPSEENRNAFIESAATDCAVAFWSTAGEPWRA